jgi:hypothetical protein
VGVGGFAGAEGLVPALDGPGGGKRRAGTTNRSRGEPGLVAARARADPKPCPFYAGLLEGLDNPKSMENPGLADFQVKAIVAYILSLRK